LWCDVVAFLEVLVKVGPGEAPRPGKGGSED